MAIQTPGFTFSLGIQYDITSAAAVSWLGVIIIYLG